MPKPPVVDIDQHIGLRLQKLRQREGVSAAALAEAIESTQQQISRYENGQNKLSAAQLFRISRCLGTPVSWFYEGFEGPLPAPLKQETVAPYAEALVKEELQVVASVWPRLNEAQRAAMLKLLDTFWCD
jgi:transcriptional regulator with XRE-family HTH domain